LLNNRNTNARQFLKEIFGNKSDDAFINIWRLPGRISNFFKSIDEAADYIERIQASKCDIYIQCGLLAQDLGPKKRGTKNDIVGLPGFFMDIDIAGDSAHEKQNLPPTIHDAIGLIKDYAIDPTLIVHSGHGLHVWWLFKEPLIFNNDDERNEAEAMNRRLQETINRRAKANGWKLDSTFDITRVLRIVGTYNLKIPEKPVMVKLLENTGKRYSSISDFEEFVIAKNEWQKVASYDPDGVDIVARGIELYPNAEPPADRLQILLKDHKFKDSWEGNRHDMEKNSPSEHALSLASLAAQDGWEDQQIADLIIAFYRKHKNNPRFPKIDPKKALRIDFIVGILKKVKVDSKVKINVKDHDLPKVTELAFKALNQTNDPKILFRMESNIVRVEVTNKDRPKVKPLQVPDIRHELTRRTYCYKVVKEDKIVPDYPNTILCEDILAEPFPPLPELTSIKEIPHFSLCATVCTTPGFIEFSGCFYNESTDLDISSVSNTPSAGEIKLAKKLLFEDLLIDFPFESDSDKINALAILILPFARKMISGPTPLHCITAPDAGTGKTLLVRSIAISALGYEPEMIVPCDTDAEWRKQITAKLINLPEFFIIDNVEKKLDNAAISSLLTRAKWEDRYLNKTLMVTCPVECVFVATGNNMTYSKEISRRVVPIRLDAKTEKPWLRDMTTFKHDPIESWVTKNRSQLIWAVFTIVNKWKSAGKPKPKKLKHRIGSYGPYCDVIGGIFEASGIVGFLDNLIDFYNESDHESQVLNDFVRDWWESYKDTEVFVGDLLDLVEQYDIPLHLGDGNEHSKKIRLGKYLDHNRNRHCGNFKIIKGKKLGGLTRWRLELSKLQVLGSSSEVDKNKTSSI